MDICILFIYVNRIICLMWLWPPSLWRLEIYGTPLFNDPALARLSLELVAYALENPLFFSS